MIDYLLIFWILLSIVLCGIAFFNILKILRIRKNSKHNRQLEYIARSTLLKNKKWHLWKGADIVWVLDYIQDENKCGVSKAIRIFLRVWGLKEKLRNEVDWISFNYIYDANDLKLIKVVANKYYRGKRRTRASANPLLTRGSSPSISTYSDGFLTYVVMGEPRVLVPKSKKNRSSK